MPRSQEEATRGAGPAAVFFDLDGTLLDTNYLHTWAWWTALQRAGFPCAMASVHALIGRSGDDVMTVLAGKANDAISAAHSDLFADMADKIEPLPGARDLVQTVHAQGIEVVVVSSAEQRELDILLDVLDCNDLIGEVVHGDAVDRAKPAPDLYGVALERVGSAPSRTLALGDTVWDVIAAQRAGLACVAVESGGTAGCQLTAAGARSVYRDCEHITAEFESSPFAALRT